MKTQKTILTYACAAALSVVSGAAYADDVVMECAAALQTISTQKFDKQTECAQLKASGGSKSAAYLTCKSDLAGLKADVTDQRRECKEIKRDCSDSKKDVSKARRAYDKAVRNVDKITTRKQREEGKLTSTIAKYTAKIDGYTQDINEATQRKADDEAAKVAACNELTGNFSECTSLNREIDQLTASIAKDTAKKTKEETSRNEYQSKQTGKIERLATDLANAEAQKTSTLTALDAALNTNSEKRCPAAE